MLADAPDSASVWDELQRESRRKEQEVCTPAVTVTVSMYAASLLTPSDALPASNALFACLPLLTADGEASARLAASN